MILVSVLLSAKRGAASGIPETVALSVNRNVLSRMLLFVVVNVHM